MIKLQDILNEKVSGRTIINVDIQPEYESSFQHWLPEWIDFLNRNSDDNQIVFLYNGADTLGMISEQKYKMWLFEHMVEEDVLASARYYDKGYAFFRFCIDQGVEDEQIVKLIKFMKENNIRDSRDIEEADWDEFVEMYGMTHVREVLETAGDMIYIPELMDYLQRYSSISLTGGGLNECLKEVIIALKALGKNYNIIHEYTY